MPKDTKEREMQQSIKLLFYVTFVGPLSVTLFLYGFFPLINYDNSIASLNDVPKFVENVRVKTDLLYEPMVKKLVVMVIDALRWDFITGPVGKVAMPVTSRLLANSSACLLKTKVQSPTVTMPRIKAITTGTVPSFIDVALNFGSKPIFGDNVLLQAKKQGLKSVFYGDDTWLMLFPNMFKRYDGTTSFVVTDFTEVDINVTRHLDNELNNNRDWSIMILHYLGLDHIGHIHGPFSPLVKTKLREMDNVIADIQLKIQEWNQNNESALFIICGDHGMKDSGGHGGSTISETTVPFIAIGGTCFHKYNQPTEIAQIDIASTLSVILGVPIPYSNLGTVFLDNLYELPISKKLFILYYNAKQVFKHFEKITDHKSHYAYHKYLEAVQSHVTWLHTKDQPNDVANKIVLSYNTALKGMKEILVHSMIKYDSHIIIIAILFLGHILCITIGSHDYTLTTFSTIIMLIFSNIILWVMILYLWESEGVSLLHSVDTLTVTLILLIILIFFTNCYLLASIKYMDFFKVKITRVEPVKWILVFGSLLHVLSLSGSSFVEEEHQTWYFFWVTLLVVVFYNSTTKFLQHSQPSYKRFIHAKNFMKLLTLLIAHRILRKLNSTGDKYAHLPDIAGLLTEQENLLGMTLVLLTALVLLIWIAFMHENTKHKRQSLVFYIILSTCIYFRHMHNNTVAKIPLYPSLRGMHEVQIFWVLLALYFVNNTYHLISKIKDNKTEFIKNLLYFIVQAWIMIAAMLHQPHNVILLPLQVIFSTVIHKTIADDNPPEIYTFVYAWCGNVFYFYQGNSNSLATIDVAAGYIGMQSYMPLINGTFLLINTYSAPVLAYFLLMYHTVLRCPHEAEKTIIQTSKVYVTWRLLSVIVYTIIISIQRHHLFVWSVFSPKLLYEAVHFTIICFITFVTLISIVIQNVINNYDK